MNWLERFKHVWQVGNMILVWMCDDDMMELPATAKALLCQPIRHSPASCVVPTTIHKNGLILGTQNQDAIAVFYVKDSNIHNPYIICLTAGRHNPTLRVNSRNALWDWILPYALLAERGESSGWQPLLADLRTFFETSQSSRKRSSAPSDAPSYDPYSSRKG